MKGRPALGGGVLMHATQCGEIVAPLPKNHKSRAPEGVAGEDANDTAEGSFAEEGGTDEESAECVDVDGVTTPENSVDCGSSSSADAESETGPDSKQEPVPGARPDHAPFEDERLVPPPRALRARRPHLYDNGVFYILDNPGHEDVKIVIHQEWVVEPPQGLGRIPTMSKTLTPANFGETRADPQRSLCLLSAWMVWRARYAGWTAADGWRKRMIDDEAGRLELMIRRLQPQGDRLLGNEDASKQLLEWVLDVAARCC